MGDALCGQQRQLGVREPRGDFLERGARRIRVLHQFELPVGEMVHRGGKLFGRRPGTVTEMVQRDFRARQILQVFSLNAGQQYHALKIIRETGQLFADFHDGFQKFALHPQGTRDGIVRFRHRRFVAPVIQTRQGFAQPFPDMWRPHDRHGDAQNYHDERSQKTEFDGAYKTGDDQRNCDCQLEQHLRRVITPFQHAEQPPTDNAQNNHQPNRPFHDFVSCAHGAQTKPPFAGSFLRVFTADWTALARRCHAGKTTGGLSV